MSLRRSEQLFEALVDSAGGPKAFASNMGLSPRQVQRMLAGAQPNPVQRLGEALAAGAKGEAAAVLDHLCEPYNGYFVPLDGDLDDAGVNAVKEAAEAIVAIAEGGSVRMTVREIREAIAALAALEKLLKLDPSGESDGV